MKILESAYWQKAYLYALKNTVVPAKAKAAADQYIEDYKVRADVAEFKLHRKFWGDAYFAVIGSIAPAKCGELADTAVAHLEAKLKSADA